MIVRVAREIHILWKIRAEEGETGYYELYICISDEGRSIRYFEGRIADRFKSYFIIAVCSIARMPRNKNLTGACVCTPFDFREICDK